MITTQISFWKIIEGNRNFRVGLKIGLGFFYIILNSPSLTRDVTCSRVCLDGKIWGDNVRWTPPLHWQNTGNKPNALLTICKSLVEINMWKLWPAKIYKCIGKRLAVIGNQYFTNLYQYIITLKAPLKDNFFKWNLQRDKSLQRWIFRKVLF